jgi:hypothetical protein
MYGFHPETTGQLADGHAADMRRAASRHRARRLPAVRARHWFGTIFVR